MKTISALVCFFLLAAAVPAQERAEPSPEIHGIADLHGMKPVEFLNLLKKRRFSSYTFWTPLKGWITKDDLPGLLALCESKEPCASVAAAVSSYRTDAPSTVGQEAVFMLYGYANGEYPPGLNSTRFSEEVKTRNPGKLGIIPWCRREISAGKTAKAKERVIAVTFTFDFKNTNVKLSADDELVYSKVITTSDTSGTAGWVEIVPRGTRVALDVEADRAHTMYSIDPSKGKYLLIEFEDGKITLIQRRQQPLFD